MFYSKKLKLLIIASIGFSFISFFVYDNLVFSLFTYILVIYTAYFYASKVRGKRFLGLLLGVFFHIFSFLILFLLEKWNDRNAIKEKKGIFRFSRFKFYTFTLLFNTLLIFLLYSLIIGSAKNSEPGDIGLAILIFYSLIILCFLLMFVNLVLIFLYERKNRNVKKHKYLSLVLILVLFAILSKLFFGNIFFIEDNLHRAFFDLKKKKLNYYIERRDITGCLDYIKNLSSDVYPGAEKTALKKTCIEKTAILYKDVSICDIFVWEGVSYRLDLSPCYKKVLSLMHDKIENSVYTERKAEANQFCSSLGNDRPPCLFIINNPSFYIKNREEILKECEKIANKNEREKCIKIYSEINEKEIISFCDKFDSSKKQKCVSNFLNIINLQK
ncbi:MAG: hypothetical protein K9M44_03000 [Candidatus Pacebacteria bacterium]|nr:hypothetical protein [Candidatus Paceibacterota bacterium]